MEETFARSVKEKIKNNLKKYLTKTKDGGIINIRCPLLEAAGNRTLRIKQCRLLKSFGLECLYFAMRYLREQRLSCKARRTFKVVNFVMRTVIFLPERVRVGQDENKSSGR